MGDKSTVQSHPQSHKRVLVWPWVIHLKRRALQLKGSMETIVMPFSVKFLARYWIGIGPTLDPTCRASHKCISSEMVTLQRRILWNIFPVLIVKNLKNIKREKQGSNTCTLRTKRYSTIFYCLVYYLLVYFLLHIWKYTVCSVLQLTFSPITLQVSSFLCFQKKAWLCNSPLYRGY